MHFPSQMKCRSSVIINESIWTGTKKTILDEGSNTLSLNLSKNAKQTRIESQIINSICHCVYSKNQIQDVLVFPHQ